MAEKSLYQVQQKKAKKDDIRLFNEREKYQKMKVDMIPDDEEKQKTKQFFAQRFQEMANSRPDEEWDLRLDQYNSDLFWREDGLANINLPIERSVIRNKLADVQSSKTIVKLIPQERDDIYKRDLLRDIWDFVWVEGDTEKELTKAYLYAFIFGTSIWFEGLHKESTTRYEPEIMENGEVKGVPYTTTKSWLRGFCLDIRDVWIDPVQDIEDASDCFIRQKDLSFSDIEGLKNDPNYDSEEIDRFLANTQTTYTTNNNYSSTPFETKEELQDNSPTKYELMHYYNRDKGTYIVTDKDFKYILREGVNPYPHGELPITLFIDHPRPMELYGDGECKLLENTKFERNTIRNQIVDHARMSNTMDLLVGEGVSLENSEMISGIMRSWNVTGDISQAQFLNKPSQDSALFNIDGMLQTDATWITGIDVNALAGSETKTAFEARLQETNKLKGVGVTMRSFDHSLTRIARQRLANIQFFLPYTTGKKIIGNRKLNEGYRTLPFEDREQENVLGIPQGKGRKAKKMSVRLKKKEGVTAFLEVTPKMLQSNLDIVAMTPTTTPILRELDRQDMGDLLSDLMQLAQIPSEEVQALIKNFKFDKWYEDSIERKGFDPQKYMKSNMDQKQKEDLRSSILSQLPLPGKPKMEQVDQGQIARQFTQPLPQAPTPGGAMPGMPSQGMPVQ